MFSNIAELKELIKSGVSNEEIIRGRLTALISEEYREGKHERVNRPNSSSIDFYEGFIPESEYVSFSSKPVSPLYSMDIVEIYNDVLNLIREHIDSPGISLMAMVSLVDGYFEYDEEKFKYQDVLALLKESNFSPKGIKTFLREELPAVLEEFKHASFDGSLVEFIVAREHYFNRLGDAEANKYHASVDWEFLDENPEPMINLSDLKGLGIAMCTEKSMVIQNIFSFLGYDTYMISGTLTDLETGLSEEHNFNVVKARKGYNIVDGAQMSTTFLGTDVDLSALQNLETQGLNKYKKPILYKTNFSLSKIKGL